MSGLDIVTFTSDFGCDGGYVAACEAVMIRVAPQARVCHVWHDVPAGDAAAGSLALKRVAPLFPPAVHLAVVDPGVGTVRRPVTLHVARGDFLVGPDNGLLPEAADALGGAETAWLLDAARLRRVAGLPPEEVSSTFHGRDVFAPAAALLTIGGDPSLIGSPIDPSSLMRLESALVDAVDGNTVAEVIEVDRFGNVGLAMRFAQMPSSEECFSVEIPDEDLPAWPARVVRTYGDLSPGELGIFCDSWGQVALALNGASAAELLTVKRGMRVRLVAATDPGPFGEGR